MAAAVVGGSFLSAFLQVLFDRMAMPEFVNLFRNPKTDVALLLKKLESEFRTAGAVLDDAENKEIPKGYVNDWLEELRDTFYQAEDLLDRMNTEALRIKVEIEYESSTSTCTSSGDEFLKKIKPEIETIVERLKGYNKQISPLGLQVGHSRIESHQKFETALVDETTIFGRDADKERIIQKLLSEDANGDNFTVVPIVGMGGLGKTTLAQIVYKDSRVAESFPARAWVCVSEEYDATRITKELLRELSISFDKDEKLFSLQGKLQVGLANKKFLLVLDDVWNDNYNEWKKLRTPFKGGSRGSKIIVTTRDQNVAMMMANERSIHHLDSMLEEDCRSLFKKHAFENRDGNENAELEEIGNQIVKKCRGLPLAVITVAGVLRSKTTPKEWKEILTSEEWTQMDIPGGPMPALRLSYIHLPSYLKRCFAYCAVFPKDYQFRNEEIIQLWQANDLLEYPGENKRIENKGEKFIHELRMRSLFHQSTDHTFSMHDLVNDLARFFFGKYCLRLEDHQEGNATISGARHFSYHPSWYDTFHKFNLLSQTKNIRTFLPLRTDSMIRLSNKFFEDALPQFMSLRVLSLSYYENIVKLPKSYSGLKQLRFLNLSETGIKVLPDWICSFYNLQTLLLSNCRQLEELPKNLGKLINLCCLDISGTPLKKMPPQMGRLINLQVLTNFVIGKNSGSTIKELGKLPMLRGELILSGLENVSAGMDASMANMEGKEHLERLTLQWNGGTTFPDWLGNSSFSSLESLSLSGCKYCHSLPTLGQLQSLQSLAIVGMSCIPVLTQDFYGDINVTKPFPSLKNLTIGWLPQWKSWYIPEGEVFNGLERLRISDCPKLIGELPQQLPSLQSLEISGCDNLVWDNGQLSILNGENQQNFSSLHQLKISKLENLKELPLQLNQLSKLKKLNISELENLEELPLQLNQLSRLKKLTIHDCRSLCPSHMSRLPASLKSLEYMGCKLELEGGGALEYLVLGGCDLKVKAEWLASFPMLKRLEIRYCRSVENQSGITTTTTTSVMTSLQSLDVYGYDDLLMSFSEGGLAAPNLTTISILASAIARSSRRCRNRWSPSSHLFDVCI
nr:putative disease resistance RPP13-like protein 1 isoform X2 [Coffea arabica]